MKQLRLQAALVISPPQNRNCLVDGKHIKKYFIVTVYEETVLISIALLLTLILTITRCWHVCDMHSPRNETECTAVYISNVGVSTDLGIKHQRNI